MAAPLVSLVLLTLLIPGVAWAGGPIADEHGQRPQSPPGAACAAIPAQDASRVGEWVPLGPYGGDAKDVAVSPASPQIVLAGLAPSSGTGALYRSIDGGALWTSVGALLGTKVFDIAFTPSGIAYIATENSVWKSTNDGAGWTQLDLEIGDNDHVYDVTIDPFNPDILWAAIAATAGYQTVSVMRSTDAGASWEDRSPPLSTIMECRAIALHPAISGWVYACYGGWNGGGQFWVSNNSGVSWVNRSAGLPNYPLYDVVHDGSRVLVGGGQLFGSQYVGLYASSNEGQTWTPLHDESWPVRAVNDVELDPADSGIILVGSAQGGVFRSANGGDEWTIGIGGTGLLSVNAVRFAPGSSSSIFLGAESMAVWESTDGGFSFVPRSMGIGQLDLYSIDSNRLNPDEIAVAFQAQNSGGVYTSTDYGFTWLVEPVPPTRYSVVRFSPEGRLYAVSDGPSSIAPEGVYVRNNDGTWTCLGPDQGTYFETELASLRFSLYDPQLILAGGSDFGVAGSEGTIWRSADQGATWTKVYESTKGGLIFGDVEIVQDGTDLTALATYKDYGANPQQGGVLRSVNGGVAWASSTTGLPTSFQGGGLCASAQSFSTIYLGDASWWQTGGLYISLDAGQSWVSTGYVLTSIAEVAVDETDDQVIYATLAGTIYGPPPDVLCSTDGGVTFASYAAGLPRERNARCLIYAPGPVPSLLIALATGAYAKQPAQAAGITEPPELARGWRGLAVDALPNPILSRATFSLSLGETSPVTLELFDLLGRRVDTIFRGTLTAGTHRVWWERRNEPNGIYWCRLSVEGGQTFACRVVLAN
jgi:photosystem II stability/assembly factor-like uncharacterized protein